MKRRLILVTSVTVGLIAGFYTVLFSQDHLSVIPVASSDITVGMDSLVAETIFDSNDIIVEYVDICQLDSFTTSWNLDSAEVVRYFQTRREIDADSAREIIDRNYHPFSLKTLILNNGSKIFLTITPSGVGISYNSTMKGFQFYMTDDNAFILPPRKYNRNWRVKILSKEKYFDECVECPENDDLYQWFLKWELTATQMNEYFDLCEWVMNCALHPFSNINCKYSGYALFQNKFYYYGLECSGATYFTELNEKLDDGEERYGFGCFGREGEKYIYQGMARDD